MAKTLSLGLSAELEGSRVVNDEDARELGRPPGGLTEVRCKNRLRCDLLVSEEAIRRFQLSIIEGLRKTRPWALTKPLAK